MSQTSHRPDNTTPQDTDGPEDAGTETSSTNTGSTDTSGTETADADADSAGDPADPTKPGPGTPPPPGRSWEAVRHLLVRLHFYAGVLVAPFLLVAALTGLAYTLTPQLDQLVYGDRLRVEQVGETVRPLSEQIAAARAAYPEGTTASVVTPPGPEDTTRVVVAVPELGEKQRTVFVDPYTAEVRGELTTWFGSTPLTTWLDDFHRNLHLGETGRLYSEVAASWLWVAVAGGLVLWIGRRSRGRRPKSARGVLLPERGARGVRRTRGWHAVTGVWLALGLLFLSATGLTWSNYAGERFGRLLDAVNGNAPALDTALPGAEAPVEDHSEHAGHGGSGGATADADPAGFDTALTAARNAGLGGTVVVTPAADAASAWTVAQNDNVWPVHYDRVAVDASSGEITSRTRWADHPVLSKLSKLGVQGHMGVLFGAVNQIALAIVAIGLTAVTVWGYRMWWQRRPTRADRRALVGKAPEPGAWRRLPLPVLVLGIPAVVALGWALPVLGVTLAGFLVVDAVVGAVRRRRTA
ncbi:PepSY-associated TM helix domain-containing protein [Streptomyces cavourensis]|uniref:PepSY domain-containing protein n=1 Tax=Streptomyces cavourensis TaxID=67258 RepID=A0AAD0Q1P7_9ACTN|nr:PepSY domain-containing protein [Streptomyces cavourensis]AXI70529.1 PepSY domain-containing protein [Streptomyces cavourensis]